MTRPLLVTDAGVRAAGLLDRVIAACPAAAAVFDGTPTNPTEDGGRGSAGALSRSMAATASIAIGGGSPIDLAKGVALLATHPGPLETYAAILGGIPKITAAVAPVIADPDHRRHRQRGRPRRADHADRRPQARLHLPASDPQARDLRPGADARPAGLAHRRDRHGRDHPLHRDLSRPRDNPPAEAIALDGLKRAVACIERAVADGGDRDARKEMMMAALEGGLTFQKGLGAVHALSHPLGGLKEPSRCTTARSTPCCCRRCCASMPRTPRTNTATLRRALASAADADLRRLLRGPHRPPRPARQPAPDGRAAMPACPTSPRHATLDHSAATNPRAASEAEFLALLTEAMAG